MSVMKRRKDVLWRAKRKRRMTNDANLSLTQKGGSCSEGEAVSVKIDHFVLEEMLHWFVTGNENIWCERPFLTTSHSREPRCALKSFPVTPVFTSLRLDWKATTAFSRWTRARRILNRWRGLTPLSPSRQPPLFPISNQMSRCFLLQLFISLLVSPFSLRLAPSKRLFPLSPRRHSLGSRPAERNCTSRWWARPRWA